MVRSPHAHARIVRIDTAPALASPGVLAVLTGADLVADGLKAFSHRPVPTNPHEVPLKSPDGSAFFVSEPCPCRSIAPASPASPSRWSSPRRRSPRATVPSE